MCFLLFKTVLLELKCYLRVFCSQKQAKNTLVFSFFFHIVQWFLVLELPYPSFYLTSFWWEYFNLLLGCIADFYGAVFQLNSIKKFRNLLLRKYFNSI